MISINDPKALRYAKQNAFGIKFTIIVIKSPKVLKHLSTMHDEHNRFIPTFRFNFTTFKPRSIFKLTKKRANMFNGLMFDKFVLNFSRGIFIWPTLSVGIYTFLMKYGINSFIIHDACLRLGC